VDELTRVQQEYRLPARKAAPPAISHPRDPSSFSPGSQPPRPVLHSPISPLSPSSPVYPDGLISTHWLAKYDDYIPSAFVAFFDFTSDPARNSLNDNQLKNEINSIKLALYRSEYKIRFAVVLLADKTVSQSPDVEDRLGNIRRATGLDPKNSLFFLPPNPLRSDISAFVTSVLSTLQPLCIEYYRDLSKHARRKKGRTNIPAPTVAPTQGTSRTLSSIGWGVRYDYKQGIFAEFRQEMDSASRHYQSALDGLLGPDGVFETTASWSPRWDEARLLSDSAALRVVRCSLWNNLTTTAAQSWLTYKDRMRDIVDRQGKGTSNYGWEAWESRWAKMMAQLILRADLPKLPAKFNSRDSKSAIWQHDIYSPAEKLIPIGERIPPSQLLHHSGYWLRVAAKHAIARRNLALDIPDEHRLPPGESPGSTNASRHGTYDTYLCPEPHVENPLPGNEIAGYHRNADIIELLSQASTAFNDHNQKRQADRLQLEVGKEYARVENYEEARNILKALWESMHWRMERWWQLAGQVILSLNNCARHLADLETLIATQFELLSALNPSVPDDKYDFMNCTEGISTDATGNRTYVKLSSRNINAPLSATAAFSKLEGHAGDGLPLQITLTSRAHMNSKPLHFSKIKARFQGRKHELVINHLGQSNEATSDDSKSSIQNLSLVESQSSEATIISFIGESNLSLRPSQTIVLECPLTFREAGEAIIEDLVLEIATPNFFLEYVAVPDDSDVRPVWWLQQRDKLVSRSIGRSDSTKIRVLPRPPKMDISIPNASRQFYADEQVVLDIEVANHEDEETESTLEVRLMGRDAEAPSYAWYDPDETKVADESDANVDLPGFPVGRLSPGAIKIKAISFTAPAMSAEIVIEVKVLYHLLSDRNTPLSKTLSADINIIRALEANHELQPQVHPSSWPSFFTVESELEKTGALSNQRSFGVSQKWEFIVRLGSFAEEDIAIKAVTPILEGSVAGSAMFSNQQSETGDATVLSSRGLIERSFILDVTKTTLEERRPTTLRLSASIEWARVDAPEGSKTTTTLLQFSDIVVPNSEPRVVCTAKFTPNHSVPGLMQLDYMLENPTFHFLTFDMTMEASEEFAFSGPKFGAVNLLPLSRTSVRFNLLPLVKGMWINPSLKVMDRWFGKQLRILAGEGCRNDKKGIAIWIDDDEDSDSRTKDAE